MEVTWHCLANEKPPESDKEHLIYISLEGKEATCIGLWAADENRFLHPIDFRPFSFVTHWTDIPEPPKK